MGSIDNRFAIDLRDRLRLSRAVETGTFRGVTALSLADIFDEVITIELSPELHRAATDGPLSGVDNIQALCGDSAVLLEKLTDSTVPTLYFLDGHWSGGSTAGVEKECPVLDELSAIGSGHPEDVIVIDDARLYLSSPSPPHRADHWPSLTDTFDAIRALRPEHVVTLLGDQIIAVPLRGKPAVDAYGQRLQQSAEARLRRSADALSNLLRVRLGALRLPKRRRFGA